MAKKNFGKRALALLMSIVMIVSMINISVLAAGEPQLVGNYEDAYYKQDGSVGTAEDWEIHLSKQAAATRTENIYDIILTVETKDTSVQLGGATHGAVTLVLDVSNSMDKRYAACTVDGCGEDEGHPTHHEYDEAYFIFVPLGFCSECWRGENAHANGHEYQGDSDTHLQNLQEAVADFLDSYADGTNEGDKRLVSVAVFGTDAVTIQNWVDVTNATARANVKALVNSLSTGDGAYLGRKYLTNGGTNIEAGLVLGRNLLNDAGALVGIPVDNQSLILFSDGAPTAKVGNVNNTSVEKVTYGGDDTGSQTDREDYDDIDNILDDISAATIAVQYNYEDENNALSDFDRVINSSADTLSVDLTGEAGKVITTVTTPTVITDPMGEGVSLVGINDSYTNETWNLADYTPTVADGITTYTITYQVEIDPTAVEADPDHEGYTILTPANGVTTLDYTVGEDETPVEAEFNVPDIRGILPRFDLTVNYVDEQGEALAEQTVETDILYGTEYTTEQKEIAHYEFVSLAQNSDEASGQMTEDKEVIYVYTAILYPVTYEYTGEVPEDAPEVPAADEYTFGTQVTVADEPELEGYTFSGWDKEDFEMPAEAVVIQGFWTAIPKYSVTYEYTGEVPAGAPEVPAAAEYEAGAAVTVAAAAYLEGYVFSGWDTENFTMPAEDVIIKGAWTVIPPNLYNVVYQYTGEIPENAPAVPAAEQYEEGAQVTVADAPEMDGYTFSGWDKEDFEMPAEDVIITGGWIKLPESKYPVSYEYTDEIPEGAPALPATAEYEAGTQVTVADEPYLEGYTFSGWSTQDFEMPAEAVVITGSWSKNPEPKYPVSYEYTGEVPKDAPELPAIVSYVAGAEVTVADEPWVEGYTFSGWDKEDFTMPAEAVVITGSWTKKAPPPPPVVEEWEGQFVLTFDKAVAGDPYTLTANEFTFELTDTARFNDGSGYIYLGENANGIKRTYTAKNDGSGKVEFTVPFIKDLENWEDEPDAAIPGSFVYTLTEVAGTAEGMTYNPTAYTILVQLSFTQVGLGWEYAVNKVDVLHDGETEVTAAFADGSSTIHLALGEDALYTNTYDDGTGSLTITKVFAGRSVTANGLAFRVVGADAFEQVVPYADFTNGSYTLNGLNPGKYTVTEENAAVSGYRLTTTGEGEVEVTANETTEVLITNTYTKRTPYRPPVTPTPNPVDPNPDPVTPDPDPVTPDPDPVTPDPDPVTPDPVEPPVEPDLPDEPIDIPDDDVPLIDEPDLPEPPVDIPDEDVPLADVPKTGDKLTVYLLMTLLSGAALVLLGGEDKKRRQSN